MAIAFATLTWDEAVREYLGKSLTTLKSDAVAAKASFRWRARNDIIGCSPLAEYQLAIRPCAMCNDCGQRDQVRGFEASKHY